MPFGGRCRGGEEDPAKLSLAGADRSLFVGFGSCSWREPVDELVELGLLS